MHICIPWAYVQLISHSVLPRTDFDEVTEKVDATQAAVLSAKVPLASYGRVRDALQNVRLGRLAFLTHACPLPCQLESTSQLVDVSDAMLASCADCDGCVSLRENAAQEDSD